LFLVVGLAKVLRTHTHNEIHHSRLSARTHTHTRTPCPIFGNRVAVARNLLYQCGVCLKAIVHGVLDKYGLALTFKNSSQWLLIFRYNSN